MATTERMQSTTGSLRDASEKFARDTKMDAQDVIEDATQAASEFYDKASVWVQENYGKSLAIVAVLGAVGMLGFMLGRNTTRPDELSDF